MKYRVKFRKNVSSRVTIEALIEATDLDDAQLKFDADDFKRYLIVENIFDEQHIIEGPEFIPVYEVE